MTDWPDSDISPLQRLQVMAAALPNSVVVEHDFAVTPDRVWQVAGDLERTVPLVQSHVRRLDIRHEAREDDRFEVDVRGYLGLRARMQVVLQPRWCVMQSRNLVVVMAVDKGPEGARFARLQVVRLPGARLLGLLVRRNLAAELRRLAALL
jgi:hypothetical protein